MTSAIKSPRGVHALEAKRPGSNDRFFNDKRELNASSKKDLAQALLQLSAAIGAGDVQGITPDHEAKEISAAVYNDIVANFKSPDNTKWMEIGASLAGDLRETADREGFMRRFFDVAELTQGNIARFRVSTKNVEALSISSGIINVHPQIVRDRYNTPEEFFNIASIRIDERDLVQGSTEIINEKYNEGIEQLMVVEDRYQKRLFDAASYNPVIDIVGGLTPQILVAAKSEMEALNIPVAHFLVSTDFQNDLLTNTAFLNAFSELDKYEAFQTGRLGQAYGVEITTDAFRVEKQKVLNRGEMYILTAPQYLGKYTSRGPIEATEINVANQDGYFRGWMMREFLAIYLGNQRGVIKMRKV